MIIGHVAWAQSARNSLQNDYVPGADRAIEDVKARRPDAALKRGAAAKTIFRLKSGKAATDYLAEYANGSSPKFAALTDNLATNVGRDLDANQSTMTDPQWVLASKHKALRRTIARVTKAC